jgi:hypothetical protein
MRHSHNYDPYLVGFGWDMRVIRRYVRERNWFAVRYTLKRMVHSTRRRSWWGIWQMEWPGCRRAVRGFTRRHAHRRGIAGWTRDYERAVATERGGGQPPS